MNHTPALPDQAKRILRQVAHWLSTPAGSWSVFGILLAICFGIFFWRFPNNFTYPNFYSEDGKIFAANIIDNGFISAVFTTFNGYFIAGIYLLEGLGFALNSLAFGGQLVTLPQALALVSYAFLALLATLPIVLLRRTIALPWLVALAILASFVPMPGFDYAIIGTIGNLKFAFLYLAVLLLVYRHTAPAGSRGIWVADAALLLCAYTNVTVYILMPFALVQYIPHLSRDLRKTTRELAGDRSFVSLLALGVLLVPQLVIVKLYGIPKMPGYLDTPFNPERSVEIFGWRTYLYGFFYPIIKFFNDFGVLALLGLAAAGAALGAWKLKSIYVVSLGLYAAFMGTFLFALNRPGVSDLYFGYKASGPDQFFYPQNWLMYFIVIVLLAKLATRWKLAAQSAAAGVIIILAIVPWHSASTYGANNFMAEGAGTAIADMKAACLHSSGGKATFVVYPTKDQVFTAPRKLVCSPAVTAYILQHEESLGLEPSAISGLVAYPGSSTPFTQTFLSPKNNLDGIKLYMATYKQRVKSDFVFTLYDDACKRQVARTVIDGPSIKDNERHEILFPIQERSAGRTYCFTLAPASQNGISPIALRLSAPDTYADGIVTVKGQAQNDDLVFSLLYGER